MTPLLWACGEMRGNTGERGGTPDTLQEHAWLWYRVRPTTHHHHHHTPCIVQPQHVPASLPRRFTLLLSSQSPYQGESGLHSSLRVTLNVWPTLRPRRTPADHSLLPLESPTEQVHVTQAHPLYIRHPARSVPSRPVLFLPAPPRSRSPLCASRGSGVTFSRTICSSFPPVSS